MNKIVIIILILFSCYSCKCQIIDNVSNHEYLVDNEDVFSLEEKLNLNNLLKKYYISKNKKVVIVTNSRIGVFNDFKELAYNYGLLYSEDIDYKNLLIIYFSKKHRKIGISSVKDSSEMLTDESIQEIIDKIITPYFKEEKYFKGVNMGIKKLKKIWN